MQRIISLLKDSKLLRALMQTCLYPLRVTNSLLFRLGGGKQRAFFRERIKHNARKYGTIKCRYGTLSIDVPLRNEFGPCYPTYAKDTVHQLFDLSDDDLVVDIGGGHCPLARANIVVDLYPQDTPHRGDPLVVYKHQKFIQASVENLRDVFADKSIDFLFTSQTLEHVDDPSKACEEIMRVARRGFIDVPRMSTDIHLGHAEHKWFVDFVDNTLIFRKKPLTYPGSPTFGIYACNAFWFDREVALLTDYYYRNVSCVQLLWKESFSYKTLHW